MDNASELNQAPVESVQNQQIAERTFKQSDVDAIVGKVRREAAESYQRQQQQSYTPPIETAPVRGLSEEDVRRLTVETLKKESESEKLTRQQEEQNAAASKIVHTFNEKISQGKESYEDFESVTGTLQMQYYPNVVQLLAEHVDNSHDVLYDLAKNRYKLAQIEQLCERNPHDAIYEIRRLGDSIKANQSTSQIKTPNAPLSQQRPSNVGTDSGPLSMKDLKMKYRG